MVINDKKEGWEKHNSTTKDILCYGLTYLVIYSKNTIATMNETT